MLIIAEIEFQKDGSFKQPSHLYRNREACILEYTDKLDDVN